MNAHRVLLIAMLLVSASAPAKDKLGLNPSPVNSDQMAVYRAFLSSYSKNVEHFKLARRTVPVTLLKDECLQGIQFGKPSNSSIVHEFDARTLPSTITLVDSEEQERIIQNVDSKQTWRDGKLVNESLERAQDAGFLILSEIAFDRKHEYAALTFRYECWGLCGHGGTGVFQKRHGAWVPANRSCVVWAS